MYSHAYILYRLDFFSEDVNVVNNVLWKSTLEFTNSHMNPEASTWKDLTHDDSSEQMINDNSSIELC